MRALTILGLVPVFLAGCASVQPAIVDRGNAVQVAGPEHSRTSILNEGTNWRLVSVVDKSTHAVSHQIDIQKTYQSGLRYYDTALDAQGIPLRVTADLDDIYSDCIVCMGHVREAMVVAAPDPLLRANAATGYMIELKAESGETLDVYLSPAELQAQLQAVDAQAAPL